MGLRDLIPPLAYRLRHNPHRQVGSYAEAVQECGEGYDSRLLAQIVREKTEIWLRTDGWKYDPSAVRLATAIGMAKKGPTLNVLDYGGAAAGHYFTAKNVFGADLSFRWHVVETASMVAECRSMESESLRFFTDRAEAMSAFSPHGGAELLFCSGTLAYVPDARELIAWFVAQACPYMALVRCELNEGEADTFGVQASRLSTNGPGPMPDGHADAQVTYPFTICSRSAVESALSTRYEIRLKTAEIVHFFEREPRLFGYFCRLR